MAYRKLGRKSAQRKVMLRDLTTDVLINGRIETTETRAKEVRKFVDKMITLAKRGDLSARRQAAAFFAPNEGHSLINETNQPAVMLVVINYPQVQNSV